LTEKRNLEHCLQKLTGSSKLFQGHDAAAVKSSSDPQAAQERNAAFPSSDQNPVHRWHLWIFPEMPETDAPSTQGWGFIQKQPTVGFQQSTLSVAQPLAVSTK
jgi:hypothetical protein